RERDCGESVAAVPAAVEKMLILHRLKRTVVAYAGFCKHLDRMSAAVHIEGLLAGKRDFHGSSRDHGEFGHCDFVGKGIALAAEAASHRSGDHAYAACWKVQNFGQGTMKIVRRLGGRPNCELIVGAVETHRAVLLHRQGGGILVAKRSLHNMSPV